MKNMFDNLTATPADVLRMVRANMRNDGRLSATLLSVVDLKHRHASTLQARQDYVIALMKGCGKGADGVAIWNSTQVLLRRAIDAAGYVLPAGTMVRSTGEGRRAETYRFPLTLEVKPAKSDSTGSVAPTNDATTAPDNGADSTSQPGTGKHKAQLADTAESLANYVRDHLADVKLFDVVKLLAADLTARDAGRLGKLLGKQAAPKVAKGKPAKGKPAATVATEQAAA